MADDCDSILAAGYCSTMGRRSADLLCADCRLSAAWRPDQS